MKIIDVNPKNEYTCVYCGNLIKTNKEYKIIPNYSPLCSSHCMFMLYHKIVSKFDKKTLIELAYLLKIPNYNELSNNSLIFEITKKYPKPILSSINKEVSSINIKK